MSCGASRLFFVCKLQEFIQADRTAVEIPLEGIAAKLCEFVPLWNILDVFSNDLQMKDTAQGYQGRDDFLVVFVLQYVARNRTIQFDNVK